MQVMLCNDVQLLRIQVNVTKSSGRNVQPQHWIYTDHEADGARLRRLKRLASATAAFRLQCQTPAVYSSWPITSHA